MLYTGYYTKDVAKKLRPLLLDAKINPDRKIRFDYSVMELTPEQIINRKNHFEVINEFFSTQIFIVVHINEYFGRKQFIHSTKMLRMGYTMIFVNKDIDQYLVMHNKQVFTKNYKDDIFFKLEMSTMQYIDPFKQALTEVLDGNWKVANQYLDMLQNNRKFKDDIERLFDTLDATVTGKNELTQKLIYVLQFTKYADEFFLKETFGDDAMYKAESVTGIWLKLFNIAMNPENIAVVYEAEVIDMEIIDKMYYLNSEQELDDEVELTI